SAFLFGPYLVERTEKAPAVLPARVFPEFRVARIRALPQKRQSALSEAVVSLKKHLAQLCESLARIKSLRHGAMTIRPVVVAGRQDHGVPNGLELRLAA